MKEIFDGECDFLFSKAAPEGTPRIPPQPSILAEYVFFPFYDYIVKYYPKWWVPNKLTLIGVFLTLTSSLLLISSMPPGTVFKPGRAVLAPASLVMDDPESIRHTPLSPHEMQPSLSFFTPASLLILCGLFNLLYCVADNTDGRLARRDRRISVIGEYLDHGLDCITSLLSTCCCFAVMGGSLANMAISVCLISFVTVLSHTLHYETGTFVWGNRIATVDEAMILFGVGMWVPLIFPSSGNALVPKAFFTLFLNDEWATYLARLKVIEVVYLFYVICQAETIFGIARRKWSMLFRAPTIALVINSVVLLGALNMQNDHVVAALPATSVPGYTLGPLTYPAIWIITCACTSSTIIHIPIASQCARLREANPLPLAGIVFVWFFFLVCPVGGALCAATLHIAQVLSNLSFIKYKANEPPLVGAK